MEQIKKEMISQKLMEAVENDNEFCKNFVAAEDAVSLQKVLTENGFEVSLTEVEELFAEGLNEILKFKESYGTDELTEDQLSDVAGGGLLRGLVRTAVSAVAGFGYGCLCAVAPAAAAGAPYVAGGLTVWSTAGYMKKGW